MKQYDNYPKGLVIMFIGYHIITLVFAVVTQLVECQPSKLNVASSNLVRRSKGLLL